MHGKGTNPFIAFVTYDSITTGTTNRHVFLVTLDYVDQPTSHLYLQEYGRMV